MNSFSMSKILGEALDPLAFIWLVLFCIAWRFQKLKQTKTSMMIFLLWLMVWCIGATPLTAWMLTKLEQPYTIRDWDSVSELDAVVCLGGGMFPHPSEVLGITANDAFDRYLTAIDLVQTGKANHLVFGGSDYLINGEVTSEGKLLNDWRKRWGLNAGEVHFLDNSSTTRDEALRVSELMDTKNWTSVYLVTSAWHMRRAEAVFLKHGVNVKPIGCDFKGLRNFSDKRQWKLFPQSGGFKSFHQFIHEIVGYHYYQLRGWI